MTEKRYAAAKKRFEEIKHRRPQSACSSIIGSCKRLEYTEPRLKKKERVFYAVCRSCYYGSLHLRDSTKDYGDEPRVVCTECRRLKPHRQTIPRKGKPRICRNCYQKAYRQARKERGGPMQQRGDPETAAEKLARRAQYPTAEAPRGVVFDSPVSYDDLLAAEQSVPPVAADMPKPKEPVTDFDYTIEPDAAVEPNVVLPPPEPVAPLEEPHDGD